LDQTLLEPCVAPGLPDEQQVIVQKCGRKAAADDLSGEDLEAITSDSRPMVGERLVRRLLASRLGRQLSSRAARSTRCSASDEIRMSRRPVITNEAVVRDTPAR